jgi:small subunit ribosomal protein S20
MARRASARKSLRQNRVHRTRNRSAKTRIGTETRKFLRAVERGDAQQAKEQFGLLTKLLHKAAAKGIMHANTVARRQSTMQKLVAKLAS